MRIAAATSYFFWSAVWFKIEIIVRHTNKCLQIPTLYAGHKNKLDKLQDYFAYWWNFIQNNFGCKIKCTELACKRCFGVLATFKAWTKNNDLVTIWTFLRQFFPSCSKCSLHILKINWSPIFHLVCRVYILEAEGKEDFLFSW